jgi:heavy metal sensor kinase
MRLSIRWRLTLWNSVGLAVMLLAFASLVYAMLRHALYEQVDHKLTSAVGQLAQDARITADYHRRLQYWIYEWKEHEDLNAVVYDANGKVVERTEQLAEDSVPPAPLVASGEQRLRDAIVPIVGRQRILERDLSLGDRRSTAVVMASLEEVDRELGELWAVLLTAMPLVLLFSGALGYVLARKALAPMERLRRSTEEITAERLHKRLPISNPRDELGRLTETFNGLIGRLEQSFAEIRRFTADASHELRTPLTAIRAEAEVALAKPMSLGEHQQLLESILEECDRLTRLTDQLLALAREEAGGTRPSYEDVDLTTLVVGVVETMRPLAEAKGVHLGSKANTSNHVRGDPARLREVFFNILDNAIKYTAERGEVEVSIYPRGPDAVVLVRDTGIGIPSDHLPLVFDRFYRVDKARSRAEGGTGLGLSIARSIINAHGGTIELASTPGQGTICTISLPLEPKYYGAHGGIL